ncbi:MAG: PHP domain-containing protein, partial [Gammaproteobacteria bacterium]
MEPRFVHLCLHTEYSLVDGLVRMKPLAAKLAAEQMPALAMTDRSNLFAMVKFYRALMGAGVKPIIGVDALVRNPKEVNKPHRLLLLVRNREGYLNLSRLVSRSYREGQHLGMAMLDPAWFEGGCDGLIAIAAGQESDIGKALVAGNRERAERLADFWSEHFPDSFYLGISRCGRSGEEESLHAMVAFAAGRQLPVVAHNDVRFLAAEDFDAHEVRVAIHEGRTLDDPRRPKNYTREQYLRSEEEMCELFADIPSALANSVEIARRCNLELTLGKNVLPEFPIPEGMTTEEYFSEQSRLGLEERLGKILDPEQEDFERPRKRSCDRLQLELAVINQMGFPGYFLIVADFIQWAM